MSSGSTSTGRRWTPILTGCQSAAAGEAVHAIAESIIGSDAASSRRKKVPHDPSLALGDTGMAVFFAYLAACAGSVTAGRAARRFLNRAVRTTGTTPLDASLYQGFTGIAWASVHCGSDADRTSDATAEIDAALEEYLARRPWNRQYDLVSGLAGFGVYALEQLPRPAGVTLLESVVRTLDETAQRTDDGAAWFTAAGLLPESQRALYPAGCYNLGVAHGIPAVIGVLAGACAAGIAVDTAKPLLTQTVQWLLSRRLPDDCPSAYPSCVAPGVTPDAARCAWCYGDPGVAAALMCAADAVGDEWWRDQALKLALRAAKRPADGGGVKDAGLCHGAAGLGHLFNRMFQISADPRLADASRFWFDRTLAMRVEGSGVGGYRAYWSQNGAQRWVDDPSLLTGSAGIALALLAATNAREPAWDRMLLASLPPLAQAA